MHHNHEPLVRVWRREVFGYLMKLCLGRGKGMVATLSSSASDISGTGSTPICTCGTPFVVSGMGFVRVGSSFAATADDAAANTPIALRRVDRIDMAPLLVRATRDRLG